jgi:hypothetical protein
MATKAYSDGYASGLSEMSYAEASSKHGYKGLSLRWRATVNDRPNVRDYPTTLTGMMIEQ